MLVIPSSLASRVTTCRSHTTALCWKITRKDGIVLRFTDWSHSLSLREADAPALSVYSPTEGIDSTARRREDDLNSANKDARGVLSSGLITATDLRAGQYDGARIDEFLVDANIPWAGYIEHSRYFILKVSYDRGTWLASIESMASRLALPIGDAWGPTCRVDLFSAECGVNPAGYEKTVTVLSISEDRKKFRVTFSGGIGVLWNASGYGNDGTLIWTSGTMNTLVSEMKEYVYVSGTTGEITLHLPAPYAFIVGDTATIRPGCNKRARTAKDPVSLLNVTGHCKDKFNNLINFQGEPDIPGRDAALLGLPMR